jgi:hypothetical protein
VSRSAAFFASLLVSLGRPAWWVLALAGFLARGGIILAVLPIVSLPSPLGLSDIFAPAIMQLRLGRVDGGVVAAIVGLLALAVVVVLGGGLIGAATDLVLIRDGALAAVEEGVTEVGSAGHRRSGEPQSRPPSWTRSHVIGRIVVVRLAAHLPLLATVAVAAVAIINATYAELTRPVDVATPLVARVVVASGGPIILVILAWFLGELAGGIAARRVVLDGEGLSGALSGAVLDLIWKPRSTLAPGIATTVPLFVILAATLAGARIAWLRADGALTDPSIDAATLVVTLMTFVAIWLAALTLIGLLTASRSAALTFAAVREGAHGLRSEPSREDSGGDVSGTFGASTHHRPGDRPVGSDRGSL